MGEKPMNKSETFTFTTTETIPLHMNLYRANTNRKNTTILYLHGGGLLYGVRDDLPQRYIEHFLQSGYDFLALDYPLAPESKLDSILTSIFQLLSFYFKNKDEVFDVKNDRYVLFGRSAGAYLCFMLCDLLLKNKAPIPAAIISLYGYARLDAPAFTTPNNHYNKLAKVSDESMEKIISKTPVTYGPMSLRFSLYIKARQEGTWITHLCGKEDPKNYSLDDETLKAFPPTILAAATLDPDVPYGMTKALSKIIPQSHLITLYKETHDFDRDVTDETGKLTYEEITTWLKEIL